MLRHPLVVRLVVRMARRRLRRLAGITLAWAVRVPLVTLALATVLVAGRSR